MNSIVHAATTSPEDSTNPMHPNQNKDLELDVITYVYSKASLPNVTSPKWIYLDFFIVRLSGRKLTSSSSPHRYFQIWNLSLKLDFPFLSTELDSSLEIARNPSRRLALIGFSESQSLIGLS